MKLATFTAGGAPETGVIDGGRIIPLTRASPGLPADMIGLISGWPAVGRRFAASPAPAPGPCRWTASACSLPSRVPGRSGPLA